MEDKDTLNNLRAFLIGGEGAPAYAPDGMLTKCQLSVEKLARACRLTRAAVYLYIKGQSRPTEPVLLQMCAVLGVPFEEGLRYCTPATVGRPRSKKVPDVRVPGR